MDHEEYPKDDLCENMRECMDLIRQHSIGVKVH